MFKHDGKIERLRDIEFFARCSMDDLRTIAMVADHVAVREGDVLAGGSSFYLLTSGEADTGDSRLRAGNCLGPVALLGGRPERDARMATDGTVLVLGRREFGTLMRRVPSFACGVATELARLLGDAS